MVNAFLLFVVEYLVRITVDFLFFAHIVLLVEDLTFFAFDSFYACLQFMIKVFGFWTGLINVNTLVLIEVILLFFLAEHTPGITILSLVIVVLISVTELLVGYAFFELSYKGETLLAKGIYIHALFLFQVIDFVLRALGFGS